MTQVMVDGKAPVAVLASGSHVITLDARRRSGLGPARVS